MFSIITNDFYLCWFFHDTILPIIYILLYELKWEFLHV